MGCDDILDVSRPTALKDFQERVAYFINFRQIASFRGFRLCYAIFDRYYLQSLSIHCRGHIFFPMTVRCVPRDCSIMPTGAEIRKDQYAPLFEPGPQMNQRLQ